MKLVELLRDVKVNPETLEYEIIFVNEDSGWRSIRTVEVSDGQKLIWFYGERRRKDDA